MSLTKPLKNEKDEIEVEILQDEGKHQDVAETHVERIKVKRYRGPIPPAAELAAYGNVLSDAPDRILTMAETQAIHRQFCEKTIVDFNIKNERRGQIFGFVLALIALGGGFILIAMDKQFMGLSVIIAEAGGFVYLKYKRDNDKTDKIS